MQGELLPRECLVEKQQDVLQLLPANSKRKEFMITFCGTHWAVVEVTNEELLKIADEDVDGYTDFNNEIIYINADRVLHRKRVILVHELLHVIADYVGIEDDESMVRALEHHVYDLLTVYPDEYRGYCNGR